MLKSIVVVDSEEEWAAVTKGLLDGGKVVRLKNRFKEPKFTGIREMTLSLAVPLPSNSILGGVRYEAARSEATSWEYDNCGRNEFP